MFLAAGHRASRNSVLNKTTLDVNIQLNLLLQWADSRESTEGNLRCSAQFRNRQTFKILCFYPAVVIKGIESSKLLFSSTSLKCQKAKYNSDRLNPATATWTDNSVTLETVQNKSNLSKQIPITCTLNLFICFSTSFLHMLKNVERSVFL